MDRIDELEKRVRALEADRDRFLKCLEDAAQMCLQHPMARAMMPKEIKERLEAISAKNVA